MGASGAGAAVVKKGRPRLSTARPAPHVPAALRGTLVTSTKPRRAGQGGRDFRGVGAGGRVVYERRRGLTLASGMLCRTVRNKHWFAHLVGRCSHVAIQALASRSDPP